MDEKRKTSRNGAISNVASTHLRKAGWTPKRSIPTSLFEQAYAAEELPFPKTVKEFLNEFGGLIICYVTKSRQKDVLEFLAERAVLGMHNGITGFEEQLGVAPLCPIGHYLFGTCILLMDSQGQVFGGSDETVTLVGTSGIAAIDNILTGVESELIEPRAKAAKAPPARR